jgi:hypothetical protein
MLVSNFKTIEVYRCLAEVKRHYKGDSGDLPAHAYMIGVCEMEFPCSGRSSRTYCVRNSVQIHAKPRFRFGNRNEIGNYVCISSGQTIGS